MTTTKTTFRPRIQALELRRYLTAALDATAFAVPLDPPAEVSVVSLQAQGVDGLDTNGGGRVSARDALVVINYVGRRSLAEGSEAVAPDPSNLDANGDGRVSALDALVIINRLGRIESPISSVETDAVFTNPNNRFDVNDSGEVSAEDTGLVLRAIERFGRRDVDDLVFDEVGYVDVNRDGILSAADAVAVINQLGNGGNQIAELQDNLQANIAV